MTAHRNQDVIYGPVNGEVLDELRQSFDTMLLLDAVNVIEHIRQRICDPQGLRANLLRLHAMAHTLIDEAEETVGEQEPIWDLAFELVTELLQFAESIRLVVDQVAKLEQLVPSEEPSDDNDEGNHRGHA